MLALLLAVALIGLTALALQLGGAAMAIVTGVLVLNACLVVVLHRRPRHEPLTVHERWRPGSFRRPPEPAAEAETDAAAELEPTLKIRRQ